MAVASDATLERYKETTELRIKLLEAQIKELYSRLADLERPQNIRRALTLFDGRRSGR